MGVESSEAVIETRADKQAHGTETGTAEPEVQSVGGVCALLPD